MNKLILSATLIMLFAGCASSKQYFTPNNASAYPNKAIASVKISPYQLSPSKQYEFISTPDGKLQVINKSTEAKQQFDFGIQTVSIAIKGNLAALVNAVNDVKLIDLSTQKELFSQNFGPSAGVIEPLAAPIFSDNLVLVPTLDGKLVVLNYHQAKLIRVISVGTKEFLNNIIYFYTNDDRMVALSTSKATTIMGDRSYNMIKSFKTAVSNDDYIYFFTSTGDVIKTDYALNELQKRNFEFANFTAAKLIGDYLYILEYSGKLIKLDAANLNVLNIWDFKDKLNTNSGFNDKGVIINGKLYLLQ